MEPLRASDEVPQVSESERPTAAASAASHIESESGNGQPVDEWGFLKLGVACLASGPLAVILVLGILAPTSGSSSPFVVVACIGLLTLLATAWLAKGRTTLALFASVVTFGVALGAMAYAMNAGFMASNPKMQRFLGSSFENALDIGVVLRNTDALLACLVAAIAPLIALVASKLLATE